MEIKSSTAGHYSVEFTAPEVSSDTNYLISVKLRDLVTLNETSTDTSITVKDVPVPEPIDPIIEGLEVPTEVNEGEEFTVKATVTDVDSTFDVFITFNGEKKIGVETGDVYSASFVAPEVGTDTEMEVKVEAKDSITGNKVEQTAALTVANVLPAPVEIKYLKNSGTDVMNVAGGNEEVNFDFDLVNVDIEDVEVERIITYYDGSFVSSASLTETGVHAVSYDSDIGSGMPGGRYDITVVATDSYGRSDSKTVSFYVNVNPVEIVDAEIVEGMNGFGILAGSRATIEATVFADGYARVDAFTYDDGSGGFIPVEEGLAIDGPVSFRFDQPGEHKVSFEISLEGFEEGWYDLHANADSKDAVIAWWWEDMVSVGTVGYDPNPPEIVGFDIVPKDCGNDCYKVVAVVREPINYYTAKVNSDPDYWAPETLNATPFENIVFTNNGIPVEYETISSSDNITFTITSKPVCEKFASGYGETSDVHFEIKNIKHKIAETDTEYAFDFENGPVNIYFDHDNPEVDLDPVNAVPFCITRDLHAYNFEVTLEDDSDLVSAQLVSPDLYDYVKTFELAEVTDDIDGVELFDTISFIGDDDTFFEFNGTFKINEGATSTEIYAERDIPITVVSTDTFCNTSAATTLMKIDLWNPRITNVSLVDTCNTYELGNEGFITYEATKLVMSFDVEDLHLLPDETVIKLYYGDEDALLWVDPDDVSYTTYTYDIDSESRIGYTYTVTFTLPELDQKEAFYAYAEAYDCCGHKSIYADDVSYESGDHTPPEIDLAIDGYGRTETWANVLDYLGWDAMNVVDPIFTYTGIDAYFDGYYNDFLSSIATDVTAYWFCGPDHFTITGNYTDNGLLWLAENFPYWVDAIGIIHDGNWVVTWDATWTPAEFWDTAEATAPVQMTFDATYIDGIEGVGLAYGLAADVATYHKDPDEVFERNTGTFAWELIPIIVDTAAPTIEESTDDYEEGTCGYDSKIVTIFEFDIRDLFFDPDNIIVDATYGSFEFEAERDTTDVDLWHVTAVWTHGHPAEYYTGAMKFDNVAPTLDSLEFFTTGICPDCEVSVNKINGGMAEVLAVLHDNNGIDDSTSDIELIPTSGYTVNNESVVYSSGETELTYAATVTFDSDIEAEFTIIATITDFCGNQTVITKTICVDTKDPVPLNWTFNPATNIVKVDFDEDIVVTDDATAQLYVWLLDDTEAPTDTDFEDYTKWQKKADYDSSAISEYTETIAENDVAVAADSGTPYYNLQEGVWYGMILSGVTDKCGNPNPSVMHQNFKINKRRAPLEKGPYV